MRSRRYLQCLGIARRAPSTGRGAILTLLSDQSLRHHGSVSRGGWRAQLLPEVVLLGELGIGTAACSSGPSAAAKGLCSAVFSAPPPADESVAISTLAIEDWESSGNSTPDQAATIWMRDLKGHDPTAAATAQHQIVTTCQKLGIPLGTYGTP